MVLERNFPVLRTERLLLRRIFQSDVDAIYNIYSDPKVAEYDVFYTIDSVGAAGSIISSYNQSFEAGREIRWGLTLLGDRSIIGTCGLMNFSWGSKRCEIGFGMLTRECGKGYMSEAVQAILEYAFKTMKLSRVEAFVVPQNEASIRLLERSGFIQEGLLRKREFFKDRYNDEIIMSLLSEDFKVK